ncbi:uncharacterized protein LOC141886678 isoform X1 [Acropora palmata]|uniref:uncharacterized protein LOC141886678 isoform X1 n=1 Tax=Acropora palmata TaxID=6131 RepID=UPI003D9FC894
MLGKTTQEVVDCKDDCYLNYLLGKSPPEDLDLSMSSEKSCICQKDAKGNTYFATYFYDKAGIAAYSAYVIQASDAKWIGSHKRTDVSWRTTPGFSNLNVCFPACLVMISMGHHRRARKSMVLLLFLAPVEHWIYIAKLNLNFCDGTYVLKNYASCGSVHHQRSPSAVVARLFQTIDS